jgi:hypothetical protein
VGWLRAAAQERPSSAGDVDKTAAMLSNPQPESPTGSHSLKHVDGEQIATAPRTPRD